ncbi:MAG: DMT family transporter, partial [Candidatus Dormibacteria bacterium]
MLAAGANSTSSVLQRKANQSEPDSLSLSPRLILDLFHRPVWFTGLLAVIVGFLLQAAALAHGELAVVEPLLVLELPFTLVLATVVFRKGLHRREWTAAGAMTAGLILLIASLSPHGGSARQVPATTWALATAASVAAICFLVAAARTSRGSRRAALLGVAT